MTEAHDQALTLHLITHVPAHEPRETDPHYHLFEQVKARMKRQGLWRCAINDDYCGGNIELHHSHIEFSQTGGIDLEKVNQQLGLDLHNDEDFQQWIESPGNLEALCAIHHRTHYGVHVMPHPLWEPLRYRKAGVKPAAEFVPAGEVADTTTVEKTKVKTKVRTHPVKDGIEVDTTEDEKTKVKVVEGHHTVDSRTERTHTTERHVVPRPRKSPKDRGFFGRLFGRD